MAKTASRLAKHVKAETVVCRLPPPWLGGRKREENRNSVSNRPAQERRGRKVWHIISPALLCFATSP